MDDMETLERLSDLLTQNALRDWTADEQAEYDRLQAELDLLQVETRPVDAVAEFYGIDLATLKGGDNE